MIRLIKNGRVIDPANNQDQVRDLYISDGVICKNPDKNDKPSNNEIIDAGGCWIVPGLVDLAARFREPGHEHKGTMASESRAALAGGITSVCLLPDTEPVIDTPAVIDLIHHRKQLHAGPHIYVLAAMSMGLHGEKLSEYAALKAAGCVGVSNADQYISNSQFMRNVMSYAVSHRLKVFLTPEDGHLAEGGCMHEGRLSTRMGLPGIPTAAETVAVTRDLALIEATGVSAHFCRLSSSRSIELIARAHREGLPVTADVSAHQLFLTEMDTHGFNSNAHLRPPLRSERDRDALREAINEGIITAICSDHQPHEADAKLAPFGETATGIAALETLLPLTLKLIHEKIIKPEQAVKAVTHGPASILGIQAGSLSVGAIADIAIIDPQADWTFQASNSLSHGKNTPFNGWAFQGRVTHTLVEGQLQYTQS